jgi:hypothetical protein
MRITPQLRRQQELWETCRLAAAAVVDSLKCPDLSDYAPADNGAGTFLSPAPNHRRPDLLEHAPADNGGWTFLSTNPESKRGLESPRSVPPASAPTARSIPAWANGPGL